jgi:phage tail sheath protein FI
MAEYLSPAVYIEEKSSGSKPIEGVGTSTGAFLGHAEKGPVGEAVPVNNFSEFQKKFGGYIDNGFLAFAVKAFFDEGGSTCYVVRTCHYTGSTPDAAAASKMIKATSTGTPDSIEVSALSPGTWGDDIAVAITHGAGDTFDLEVSYKGKSVESYTGLVVDKTSGDHVETKVNDVSSYIVVADQTSGLSAADARPAATTFAQGVLTGGADGLSSLAASDYTGDESLGSGLHAFDKIDGINIVAIPDALDRSVHIGGMTYCENRGDCFYVADSQESLETADNVLNYKLAQGDYAGGNAINSKYGALYSPWISVLDPRTGSTIDIPPSGAVAGIYARTDGTRGVHKAPAGIVDGKFRTALDVVKVFTDADQAKLNPKGINVIRKIKGVGNVAWGGRTVSSDPEWRYINVRRLFLFLEKSIENSTKWIVFEPNDRNLWKSITRNVSAFLKLQWMSGALVGDTEEEAYYVKCDEETNPQESIDLGRVITEIGVAPSKPAEFVIFRIAQWQGGSEVSE